MSKLTWQLSISGKAEILAFIAVLNMIDQTIDWAHCLTCRTPKNFGFLFLNLMIKIASSKFVYQNKNSANQPTDLDDDLNT